ncbi:ATP-binding protein [Bradyrhizobium sp.]|uniref:ATP-binding protein n=1 Tax=Bradyrhizobium sp. TaxID=376 RepID=UPI003C6AD61F
MIISRERQNSEFEYSPLPAVTALVALRHSPAMAEAEWLGVTEEYHAFASFRLYPRQRALLRNDEFVEIGSRAFDVLHLLVSRAGETVSTQELMRVVWSNLTVEEANLRVQIGIVRKILSQCEAARRAIETVPLRGYRFILSVRHSPNAIVTDGFANRPEVSLPALMNPVIGRDEVIVAITTALKERSLITITGPGGIGKTTVAIATANHFARDFQGAIGFVDLSYQSDVGGVVSAISEALALRVESDPVDGLCDRLCQRRTLLILDTCEHIVEPVARLSEQLLARCQDLTLLMTSREALRAEGEWVHRLPSLTFPDECDEVDESNFLQYSAIAMFVDRVSLTTRFEPNEHDFPSMGEICRRLDGIPLALEFAAARVVDLGLAEIAANLNQRFAILTRGRRTALPRHRTLSAAIEWSYGLLSLNEQHMLRYLATIGGSISAADAVASRSITGCEHPLNSLGSLYEKSILTVETWGNEPVYRLPDTTRAYVAGLV